MKTLHHPTLQCVYNLVTALETLPLKSYSNSSRSLNLELSLLLFLATLPDIDLATA